MAVKKGDKVRLKSGGPKMTVETTGASNMTGEAWAHCVWFDGMKRMEADFDPEVLEVASDDAGPRVGSPRRI